MTDRFMIGDILLLLLLLLTCIYVTHAQSLKNTQERQRRNTKNEWIRAESFSQKERDESILICTPSVDTKKGTYRSTNVTCGPT